MQMPLVFTPSATDWTVGEGIEWQIQLTFVGSVIDLVVVVVRATGEQKPPGANRGRPPAAAERRCGYRKNQKGGGPGGPSNARHGHNSIRQAGGLGPPGGTGGEGGRYQVQPADLNLTFFH